MSSTESNESTAETPLPSRQIMVLLVDDQPMIGEAIRRSLASQQDIGFRYCSNPADAVALAETIKPTVILQDLVMPGVSGLDLVRQYREAPLTKMIPIIVLSSKEEPAIKSDAFKLGANDYLVKLPDQIELIARIRYHSAAYVTQLERDEAYRALGESQRQLVETNRELERLTTLDGLTGLSNRRYFNEYIDAEWKRAIRQKTSIAVMMIDVDHFKQYNDTYGHLGGDEVLRKVAAAVGKNCERSTDLAARFGGEEFVILLPMSPVTAAEYLGKKLCGSIEALEIPHSGSSVGKHVTVSVGVAAMVPTFGESYNLLVDSADKALYEAKKTGRNRVVAST